MAGSRYWPDLAGSRILVETLHVQVPAQVNVAVQTNGTLLDRPMLETSSALASRSESVSTATPKQPHGIAAMPTAATASTRSPTGCACLSSADFRACYSGLLCTIDRRNDPVSTYEALLKFNPPALDFLLPHANWSCPPPGTGYADWLISVFERWYAAPRQETRIRLFRELIQLVLGQPSAVEGLGMLPSTLVVIDTDGSIKQLDSLSSAYPGAADTGLHVNANSLDEALNHPTTVARQIGAAALSAAVPGLSGDGDLRRRPVPAPVPARDRLPQPFGVLRGPAPAHHATCATGSSQT